MNPLDKERVMMDTIYIIALDGEEVSRAVNSLAVALTRAARKGKAPTHTTIMAMTESHQRRVEDRYGVWTVEAVERDRIKAILRTYTSEDEWEDTYIMVSADHDFMDSPDADTVPIAVGSNQVIIDPESYTNKDENRYMDDPSFVLGYRIKPGERIS